MRKILIAAALLASLANFNPAQAGGGCSGQVPVSNGSGVVIGSAAAGCGSTSPNWQHQAAAALIAFEWVKFMVEGIAACEGILGYEKVNCTQSVNATKAEVDQYLADNSPTQAREIAQLAPSMGAVTIDLAAVRRNELIAQYAATQLSQYASVR